jgi:hypothetical protein
MLGWLTTTLVRKGVYLSNHGPPKVRRYDLWGWLLFIISALFFIVSSIRSGDMVGLLGGLFFLLACVAFLASYLGTHKR